MVMLAAHCIACDKVYSFDSDGTGLCPNCWGRDELAKKDVEQALVDMRDTATKHTNPKDEAASNRLDLSLVPATARAYLALGLAEGDQKYGGYNWRVAGIRPSVYYAACGRHLDKWFNDGEDVDPVTQVPHLASAICCLAILIDADVAGNMNDDRPPRNAKVAQLLEKFEGVVAGLRRLWPNKKARYRHEG